MYYLPNMPDGYRCFERDQPAGQQVYKRLFGHPSGRFYDSIVRFEPHVWWLLDGRSGLCECFLCGNYKAPPGPPKPRNKLDVPDRQISAPKPSIRRDGPTLAPQSVRQRPQRFEEDNSSRSTSTGPLAMERSRRPARGLALTDPVDEEGTANVWKKAIIKMYNARDDKRGIEDDTREDDSTDWLSERDIIPQYFTQIEQQHSFIPRRGELVLWCPIFPDDLFLQRDPKSGHYRLYDAKARRFVDHLPQWRGGVVTAVPSRTSQNGAVDFPDLLNLQEKKTSLNTSGFRVETMPDPNSTDKSSSKQYRYVPLRSIRPLSQWQLLLSGIPQKDLHASVLYALTCMTSMSLIDKWRINGDWKDGAYISARGIYLGSELIIVGDAIRLTPESTNAPCTDIMVVDTIRLYLEGMEYEHTDLSSTKLCSRSKVTFLGKAYTCQSDRAFTYPPESGLSNTSTTVSPEDIKGIFRPVGTALYGSWHTLHHVKDRWEVSYDQVLGRLYEAEAIRLWSGQRQQMNTISDSTTAKPDLGFDMSSIIAGRRYATKVDERIPGPPVTDPTEIRWIISDYRAQALDVASINGYEVGPYFEARTPATLAAWRAHIKISNGEKVTTEELTSAMGPRRQKTRPNYAIATSFADIDSSPGQSGGKRRGRPPGSKLINGRIVRAEELADMIPTSSNPMTSVGNTEVHDIPSGTDYDEEEDEGLEVAETQTPLKHSSQMAGAALATDSEDIDEDSDNMIEDDNEETDEDGENGDPSTSQALLAAYGAEDEMSEDEIRDTTDTDDPGSYLSAWRQISVNKKPETKPATQRQPMSKSQIMESVEQGHGSTLASVAGQIYDDSDVTDVEDVDLETWMHPRHGRGGTEESSGGDYRPEY